ncbi:MAG: TolC family protein [Bacteroidetes bacterium]|nr:MAG: TolC family protein [Bacteroidota bacterium]
MKNYELRITNYELRIAHLFLIILMMGFTQSKAQTLDSLVSEAMLNNPLLKSLNYKITASEYKANSADALPPPSVGLDISQIPFSSLDLINEPFSQSLIISQMFPLGGKISAMVDAEKKNVIIQQDNYQTYKLNLITQIKMAYYNIWLVDRKIEIEQGGIDLLNDLQKSLSNLYEINRISQADILTIKSESATYETQLLIYRNQRDAELFKINKLLGRNLDSKEMKVTKDLKIEPINLNREELEQKLVNNNPELKRMNSMIEMNKSEIIANDKEKIPDLMLQGMFMRMPKGMPLTTKTPPDMIDGMGKTEYMYGLMASFTLPFMPWSVDKYNYKTQELQTSNLSIESERNDMQREMNSQLKFAYVKMQTSYDLIKLYSDNVIPLYEKARSSQISQYQSNQTNINTVIDTGRMLLMQTMNYYMAQADYLMAIAEIEMITGEYITK